MTEVDELLAGLIPWQREWVAAYLAENPHRATSVAQKLTGRAESKDVRGVIMDECVEFSTDPLRDYARIFLQREVPKWRTTEK